MPQESGDGAKKGVGTSQKKASRLDGESSGTWRDFRLPGRYTAGVNKDAKTTSYEEDSHVPTSPLLVFINSGSGGHVGEQLAHHFKEVLGEAQVFELGKHKPDEVLQQLWANFKKAAESGDQHAAAIQQNVRLIACGGDGTIAWVLNSVRKLNMQPCPPAAVVPLGTGNGLSINFGWGKTMRANWISTKENMLKELKAIAEAEVRNIDIWDINFEAPSTSYYNKDDIPAGMSVKDGSTTDAAASSRGKMEGQFVYYFTYGLDAEGAYRFDHLRNTKPKLTAKRKINIFWYMWFIVRTGWFCGASPLKEKIVRLQVKNKDGQWEDIEIAESLRAMIIINLQTYSGGRDIWGLKDERPEVGKDKGFVSPIFDDGLLEVVGLEGGFKSWAALSGVKHNLHGLRLAQANELKITYASPKAKKGTAMRLDGEPWWQSLPHTSGEKIEVHIKHSGTARMLLNATQLPWVTKKLMAVAKREEKVSSANKPRESART